MIAELHPFGDVLQIGFGQKQAASQIAQFHPKSYILVESDPFLIEKAQQWVQHHPSVRLISDLWQQALLSLGCFDTIYCELAAIGGMWPELTQMRYSDHDLQTLCESASKTASDQLFRFLHELAHNGQITPEQLARCLRTYKLTGTPPQLRKSYAQTLACLKICLESHMRPGSRFGAPLSELEVYEEPLFSQIAADPYVEIRTCEGGIIIEKYKK